MSFLKAEWRKLALANYSVDPDVLRPYLPAHTEMDLWNNTCYVSLVGFMFLNTRLMGVPIPFHRNFEEVNLRFYVKQKDGDLWKRGVVFIKEIVPRRALTFVANTIYKEHYQTLKMRHEWQEKEDHRKVGYYWQQGPTEHHLAVKTHLKSHPMEQDSEAAFITEHYWGYTRLNAHRTSVYEVTHPQWQVYDVLSHDIQVDFGMLYGEDFRFLNHAEPISVMLAEGSEITVESARGL